MALTPNLRKVGSLLLGTDVFGEHDSRVIAVVAIARSGMPLKDKVVVAVCGEALDEAAVRLMKAAGWLIRSRSSTRKLEWVGKMDGRVWWSGSAAAGRYSPGYRAGGARTLGIIIHLFSQSLHYSGPPLGVPVGGLSTEVPKPSPFSSAASSQLPGSQ